jgi:hypothetical protein
MVREAISSALPKPRKKTERRRWKMQPAVEFVDAILAGCGKTPISCEICNLQYAESIGGGDRKCA